MMLFSKYFEAKSAEMQYALTERHIEETRNIYREMRGWRHDYKNHIQTMKALLSLGEAEKLREYLDRLNADLSGVDALIKSGDIALDAILNSKVSLAQSFGIAVDASANAAATGISAVDLCVIIGNLLDNAIEACGKMDKSQPRFIRVYIDIKKSQLYISVTNSAPGRAKKRGGIYVTDKVGFHGLGLSRIDRAVKKNGGWLKRRDEDGAFSTEIMLPITRQ